MNSKTEEMLNRTFQFAVDTLKFLNALPPTTINKVIINQLAKAATSIGANYEESQAAESKDDFIHKIGIVSKGARESKFWLRVLNELINSMYSRASSGHKSAASCEELYLTFSSAVANAKAD